MVGLVALPNEFTPDAEYQETIRCFSYLYRRRFCTFRHVLHRACSSHMSRFHVALMIRFSYSLGILDVFLRIVDYYRPAVRMHHLYLILNNMRVPRLWVEPDLSLKFEI